MSVSRLLAETNSRELSEWMAYFNFEDKQEKEKNSAETLKAKFAALVPAKQKDGKKHNSKSKG